MRFPAFLVIFFIFISGVTGQNSEYKRYRKVIPGFMSQDVTIRVTDIENQTKKEIDVINFEGNVLRFKVGSNNNILPYFGDIFFILYDFTGEWLSDIRCLNQKGKLTSMDKILNLAWIKFKVNDPDALKLKLRIVEEHEGNIDMNDNGAKLVLQQNLNSKNEVISEFYISSDDYWDMLNLQFRP